MRGGGCWTPEAAEPGGCWPSPAARTQGPKPAPLPGLRLCVCARGRRSQCLWSGVCTSRLRDSRAPGPPDLATVVLPSGLVPRSSSPDSAAPRKPPGSCFPPPQRFPSAAPSPLPRGARAPPGAPTRPGWARAPGTCAAGRGRVSAGDRPLTYGHVCPLCPTWAGTGSQGSGAPRRRWGGREGRGERWRDKETQRKRTRGAGAGKSGLSAPVSLQSLQAPPALSGSLLGAALGGRLCGGDTGRAVTGPVRSLAGGFCSSVSGTWRVTLTGPSAQASRHAGLRARRGGPAP